ncbi:MAG TPA: PaaI family thioesterase [Pseudonocardiaceae bacterium]|nr:PaaI family thioesterase [Pseudonocardiaceae bacterium]
MGAEEPRSRTYAWADPHQWLAHAATLSGLEMLQRMAKGLIPPPPIAETLGMSSAEVEHGRFAVTVTPAEFHYNALGVVHGGVLAAILDTAAGCAVYSTLPVGMGCTSLDLHTRFFAAVRVTTGEIRCEGTVVHRGSRAASATARLEDRRGRLLAQASSTCLLMPAAGSSNPAGRGDTSAP